MWQGGLTTKIQSTRQRILEAAAALLAASNGEGVSIREVCQAAGVQAPTVYHHFGDKHGLLDAVVADGFERYVETKRAQELTDDPIADLVRGWSDHVEFGVSHPAFYTLMYGSARPRRRPAAAQEVEALLRQKLERIALIGRLRLPIDPAVEIVLAATVGVTLALIERQLPADARLSAAVRDAVFGAIIDRDVVEDPPSAAQAAALAATVDATPDLPFTLAERALLQEFLQRLAADAD